MLKKIDTENTENIVLCLKKNAVQTFINQRRKNDKNGYYVGGKTGTSQNYKNENENLNTFISIFPSNKPKYGLLVMLEDPQVAKDLIYNYKGIKIKGFRNEAGWNSVYVAGKIIKRIGPILAINSEDFNQNYVAEKNN